jgi:hypothetical protein
MFIESNALGAVSIRTELLSLPVNGIGWTNARLVRLESTKLLGLSGIAATASKTGR